MDLQSLSAIHAVVEARAFQESWLVGLPLAYISNVLQYRTQHVSAYRMCESEFQLPCRLVQLPLCEVIGRD